MPKRRVPFFFAVVFVLLGLAFVLRLPAETVQSSSAEAAPSLPGVPEDCKIPGETPKPETSAPQSQVSPPSAEVYEKLGTLYGRAGQFSCAVAALEEALAQN